MYFVIQPCYLERKPSADYCNTAQLPSSVSSDKKIYDLDKTKKMAKKAVWEHFNVTYISVNPLPVACSSSGIIGGAYLLLFLPYLILTLYGLRAFQMIRHCEDFQKNIERIYVRELDVPENKVGLLAAHAMGSEGAQAQAVRPVLLEEVPSAVRALLHVVAA
jgi:hypothetical protein